MLRHFPRESSLFLKLSFIEVARSLEKQIPKHAHYNGQCIPQRFAARIPKLRARIRARIGARIPARIRATMIFLRYFEHDMSHNQISLFVFPLL